MVADIPARNIAVFAGGTGGHVYPALAVAQELDSRGYSVHWLGTGRGLESRVVPAAGYPLHTLRVRGLRGKGLASRLQGVLAVFAALFEALQCLRRMRPACALGMGGYVAGPAGLAAWLLRVPLVIHEQNSVAGTTNRLLCRFARRVLSAYPGAFDESVDAKQVGNPVRAELLRRGECTDFDYSGQRPLRLLVVGGSQGAQAINELVPAALPLLPTSCHLDIRHQSGPAHSDVVMAAYEKETDTPVEVLPYIEDMASAYAWADLVLCRAGALTIAELTIMSRPSILVPLPQAIDNHQAHNAEWLTGQGACLLMPQSELSPQLLADTLNELATQPARLAAMAAAAAAAARPQATRIVADICEEVRREP